MSMMTYEEAAADAARVIAELDACRNKRRLEAGRPQFSKSWHRSPDGLSDLLNFARCEFGHDRHGPVSSADSMSTALEIGMALAAFVGILSAKPRDWITSLFPCWLC